MSFVSTRFKRVRDLSTVSEERNDSRLGRTRSSRLLELENHSLRRQLRADAAQFADKELIHISRSIFPRRPWSGVNHWPLYPFPPLSRLMTSMTLTEVTLPGRIRYITRCTRRREIVARSGTRRKEGRRGGGWNVSCARGERRAGGAKAKDVEWIEWNRGNAQ